MHRSHVPKQHFQNKINCISNISNCLNCCLSLVCLLKTGFTAVGAYRVCQNNYRFMLNGYNIFSKGDRCFFLTFLQRGTIFFSTFQTTKFCKKLGLLLKGRFLPLRVDPIDKGGKNECGKVASHEYVSQNLKTRNRRQAGIGRSSLYIHSHMFVNLCPDQNHCCVYIILKHVTLKTYKTEFLTSHIHIEQAN